MTIWLTSDQHYGHKNIIEYSGRPFRDVDHMTSELIERHNRLVGDADEVWHLGDFSLDARLVARILPTLRGKHHLVVGNHDACHPMHHRHVRAEKKYLAAGFVDIAVSAELDGFLLQHMPYSGDHADRERYTEWRPRDEGRWLLHGHVHESWKVRDRMINVGVDQWGYAPVTLDEVIVLTHRCGRS
jgi:calcineurin-like phosphoesterase family protein